MVADGGAVTGTRSGCGRRWRGRDGQHGSSASEVGTDDGTEKQLKAIAAKTVLFERQILAGLMFNRSICIQHKLQVTLIIVSADYKSVDV